MKTETQNPSTEGKTYMQIYYAKNRDEIRRKAKEKYQSSKNNVTEEDKKSRYEKYRESQKRWYNKNKEIIKEKSKIYRENNREKLRIDAENWRNKNREKYLGYLKSYYKRVLKDKRAKKKLEK